MNKYAILLSGGVDNVSNSIRYHNDLAFAYKVLYEKLGYKEENIVVLYADGRNINYKDVSICTKIANREAILASIENLSLVPEDQLLFLVSNHGSSNQGGYINLWGKEVYITLKEFVDILNDICCRKIVVMGQCFGGNVLKYEMENTCIITANAENLYSFSQLHKAGEEPEFDEFLYHFLSYFNGCYPDGTLLETSKVENNIKKAYTYAWENDTFNWESSKFNPNYKKITPYSEIPQFKNSISDNSIISL